MLVMDVPTDINQVDPRQWFGYTGRQLGCLVGVGVCAVGAVVCQFTVGGQVADTVNQVVIIPIVLLVFLGWFRKSGLSLEDWLSRYWQWRMVLSRRPLLCEGSIPSQRRVARRELKRVDEHAAAARTQGAHTPDAGRP